jgi:hypothetical protein
MRTLACAITQLYPPVIAEFHSSTHTPHGRDTTQYCAVTGRTDDHAMNRIQLYGFTRHQNGTTHSLATVHVTFWSILHGTVYGLLHGMQHPWHAGCFQLGTSAITYISAQPARAAHHASEVASTHCAERAGAQHWQPVRLTYFGGRSIGSELDSGRTRCEKVKETREGDAVGRRPPTAGSDASWGGVEGGESSHGSPQWEKGRLNAGRNIGSDLERLAFLFRGERTEGASSACPGDCVAVSWTWQCRTGEPWPLPRASRAARTAPNCTRVDSCSACVSRAVRTASNCVSACVSNGP